MNVGEWIAFLSCFVALLVPLCMTVWRLAKMDHTLQVVRRVFKRLVQDHLNHEQRIIAIEKRHGGST